MWCYWGRRKQAVCMYRHWISVQPSRWSSAVFILQAALEWHPRLHPSSVGSAACEGLAQILNKPRVGSKRMKQSGKAATAPGGRDTDTGGHQSWWCRAHFLIDQDPSHMLLFLPFSFSLPFQKIKETKASDDGTSRSCLTADRNWDKMLLLWLSGQTGPVCEVAQPQPMIQKDNFLLL